MLDCVVMSKRITSWSEIPGVVSTLVIISGSEVKIISRMFPCLVG